MNQLEPAAQYPQQSGAVPIGLIAPSNIQAPPEEVLRLQTVATQLLKDPLKVQQLTERVYQLMKQDLQCQRERLGHYGGRQ